MQAIEPITPETLFQIWSRISLRTALEAYPVFDKKSLKQMMSYTDGLNKPGNRGEWGRALSSGLALAGCYTR